VCGFRGFLICHFIVRVRLIEMSALGWGAGVAAWVWRHQLWVWEEEMLGELSSALAKFVLQPNITDQWVWRHDPSGGYSVRGAYEILTAQDAQAPTDTSDLIW
jgi:hypothetical protein